MAELQPMLLVVLVAGLAAFGAVAYLMGSRRGEQQDPRRDEENRRLDRFSDSESRRPRHDERTD